jgi:cytochrome c oxidase subunit 2
MWKDFPLFPEQASTIAASVDSLYLFLIGISVFFSILIFTLIFCFAIIYRRRSEDERPKPIHGSMSLELFWSGVPLVLTMVMFGWGASLYFTNSRAPEGAMELHVVGKQWMWKIQHPEGPREINELHVPTGQAVRLIMTSEDVIHSFYVPAFRIKMDVLPGRYTTAWFEATQIGEYHLFCAEYCGNEHSRMGGKVIVMDPVDYERWVSGEGAGESMAARGARLFTEMRCDTCHQPEGTGRGPSLDGIFGSVVALENGQSVQADESYLRESILNPGVKVVAGFQPVMPTFQGQINEEQLLQIIAYLKTLGRQEQDPPAAGLNRGAQPQ